MNLKPDTPRVAVWVSCDEAGAPGIALGSALGAAPGIRSSGPSLICEPMCVLSGDLSLLLLRTPTVLYFYSFATVSLGEALRGAGGWGGGGYTGRPPAPPTLTFDVTLAEYPQCPVSLRAAGR